MHAHSYLYFVTMSSDEPGSLLVLKFHFRIDPYSGNIEGKTTWAARINHSRRNANLKPFVVNRSHSPRVFLIAIHDIPETTEFLWNYNDSSWELHSNSQTLPE